MSPEVTAASIAAVVSLVSLVLGVYNSRRLEKLKADLTDKAMAYKAMIDYQYDARRRLYVSYQPAMFQLLELSQNAIRVIKGLTNPEIWPKLAQGERTPPTELRATLPAPTDEALDAIYGLYAPLVVIRGMGRGLTQFDLSLEPYIELQYYLATKIYGSFKDDFVLAKIDQREYTPFAEEWRELREKDPEKYWWQGLTMGPLEEMLDIMTAHAGKRGPERLVTFGEFEMRYKEIFDGQDEFQQKSVAAVANPLYKFQPPGRPIFWRMLVAQARLYQALLRINAADPLPTSESDWLNLLRLDDPDDFRTKRPEPAETLRVTDAYLKEKVITPWRRLHHSTQRTQGSARVRWLWRSRSAAAGKPSAG